MTALARGPDTERIAASIDLFAAIVRGGLCRGDDGALVLFCVENAPAGASLSLNGLILDWLAGQPGFSRRPGAALPPGAPRPLVASQDAAHERWLEHHRGLLGDPTGAARLRDDLFPGCAAWTRRPAGAGRWAASVVPAGGHRALEGASLDEAGALIAAVLRAYRQTRGPR